MKRVIDVAVFYFDMFFTEGEMAGGMARTEKVHGSVNLNGF